MPTTIHKPPEAIRMVPLRPAPSSNITSQCPGASTALGFLLPCPLKHRLYHPLTFWPLLTATAPLLSPELWTLPPAPECEHVTSQRAPTPGGTVWDLGARRSEPVCSGPGEYFYMQVSLQKRQCSRQVEACSRHQDLCSQDFLLRSGFHESSQKTKIKESVAWTGPLAVEGLGKPEPQDRPRISPHTELLVQPPNTLHLPRLSTWCLDPAGHSLPSLCPPRPGRDCPPGTTSVAGRDMLDTGQ